MDIGVEGAGGMRESKRALVFNNGELAGFLSRSPEGYAFIYAEDYFHSPTSPSISLTLSKKAKEYRSKNLFPFFYGMLAEGENKKIQCRLLKIDERDHFTRLLKTADRDTIGSVTVKEDDSNP